VGSCYAAGVFSLGSVLGATTSSIYMTVAMQRGRIRNHENVNVRNIGQGEARHTKYKRLKLGGGQAYDRSND
jgi:hypothetical protein